MIGTSDLSRWSDVTRIIDAAAASDHVAPAVSLLVGSGEHVIFEHCAGVAGPPHRTRLCDHNTIFDVASLTKPLVTAALTLEAISRGLLSLETTAADVLTSFADAKDSRRAEVTVRDLLRHDSGLPAYQRYFEDFTPTPPASTLEAASRRAQMFTRAATQPLERDPRVGSVYSDLGFLVLGGMLEVVSNARIDALAQARLFGPLGLVDAGFVETRLGPSVDLAQRCASGGTCEWRQGPVHGLVQDENAWAMGGVATHAGLFATARGVHRLVAEWVAAASDQGLVLDGALVRLAWNREAAAQGAAPSTWALGWDTPTFGASSAGSWISRDAVGHLGYTGTSVWIDPTRQVHVVLLTNRIAYGRSADGIRALRPRLHDAVFTALEDGPLAG